MSSVALAEYRARILKREAERGFLKQLNEKKKVAETRVEVLTKVEAFFNVLADKRRDLLEGRVQALVDSGLKKVFGSQYSFRVRSSMRGKNLKTEFFLEEGKGEINILDAAGGGIADVVSFLLRVVMLVLQKPKQRRLLILDEPFKWVSEDYAEAIVELLQQLSEQLAIQIIMITHRADLRDCGTLIEVTQSAGKAKARVVRKT